jgi:hypothetical protein
MVIFFWGILWWFHLGHTYHRLIALNYALGFRVYHVFIRTKTQPFILSHDVLSMSKTYGNNSNGFVFWLRITIQAQQEEEKQIGYRPGKT